MDGASSSSSSRKQEDAPMEQSPRNVATQVTEERDDAVDMELEHSASVLPQHIEVSRVKHSSIMALDCISPGAWVITNTITRERVRLAPGEYELVFDEDSDVGAVAGVLADGQEYAASLNDLFKTEVFQTAGGELMVRKIDAGEEEVLKHRAGSCVFTLQCIGAALKVAVYVFIRTRALKQQCWWPLKSVYELCKCDMFGGQASKWYFNMNRSWSNMFKQAFKSDQLVHGVQTSSASVKKEGLLAASRCLPEMSVSTVGLIALLTRWIHKTPQHGGLRSKATRDACNNMLLTLLGVVEESGKLVFGVVCDHQWVPEWPRPPRRVDGRTVVEFVVEGGSINFAGIVEAGRRPDRSPVAHGWSASLRQTYPDATTVPAQHFLGSCSYIKGLEPLLNQVTLHLALALEAKIGSISKLKEKEQKGSLRFTWADAEVARGGPAMELKLASYTYNCRWRSKGQNVWGLATDEGMVHGLPLQTTVLFLSDNTCMLACPQVETAFDDEAPVIGKKRAAPLAPEEVDFDKSEDRYKRHCNWLERTQPGKDPKSWRPVVHQRVGAKHWLENVDNQLKFTTQTEGLLYFKYDAQHRGLWASWATWPHLSLSLDLGPKGLAAYNAMENLFMLNVDKYPDNAHGVCRDFDMMLNLNGLRGFWLCLMIVWNAEFGPDREHWRRHQLHEAMAACLKGDGPASCPLFLSFSKDLVQNLKQVGFQFDGVDEMQEAWDHLKSLLWQDNGFRRCNLNRFLGALHTGSKRLQRWEIDRFQREWLAVEMDLVGTKKIAQQLVVRTTAADEMQEGGGSTASHRVTFESKTSLAFAKNAIVTSVAMLQSNDNKRAVQIITVTAIPVMDWHAVQSRELRSSDGSEAWMKGQLAGGLFDHIENVATAPSDPNKAGNCGFITTEHMAKRTPAEEAVCEDDFARMFGSLSTALVACRVRRTLHLTLGWPLRLARVLIPEKFDEEGVMKDFREHLTNYEELKNMPGRQAVHNEYLRRHSFSKISVLQMVMACRASDFVAVPELKALLFQRLRLPMQTQVVEDCIATEKNTQLTTAQKKFKKPEASMAAVLRCETLSKRHGYKMVPCDLPLDSKGSRLPSEAFKPCVQKRSLDFKKVQGTQQAPDWWSPGPSNHMVPIADLQTLRDAKRYGGGFGALNYAWLGEFVDSRHSVLIRVANSTFGDTWLYGLTHFSDSCAAVWPVKVTQVAGYDDKFVTFETGLLEPSLVSVFDVEEVQAVSVVWKSWFRQYLQYTSPDARAQLSVPVPRLFFDGAPDSLIRTAARQAFWGLKPSFLKKVSEHLNLDAADAGSVCGMVFGMVQQVLQTSDDETANIVSKRMAWNDIAAIHSGQLLQLDEAVDCMEVHDVQEVQKEQRTAEANQQEHRIFVRDFAERRRRIDDAKMAGRRKAKAKAKSAPKKPNFEGQIPQAEAKKYLPGDGRNPTIWKDRTRRAWNGHCQPRIRISEPWGDSEARALHRILKRLWTQYMEVTGGSMDQCPYEFDV